VGKAQLMTDGDASRVAGCIFSHPHSGQNQDQIQWVCQEAVENKNTIKKYFTCT
jgi:hypothetical protein